MKALGCIVFLITLGAQIGFAESQSLSSILSFIENANNFFEQLRTIKTTVTSINQNFSGLIAGIKEVLGNKLNDIFVALRKVSTQIQDIRNRVLNRLSMTERLLEQLPDLMALYTMKNQVAQNIEYIDSLHRTYEFLSNNSKRFNRLTLLNFAKQVTTRKTTGLLAILEITHHYIVPGGSSGAEKTLLQLLVTQMQVSHAFLT